MLEPMKDEAILEAIAHKSQPHGHISVLRAVARKAEQGIIRQLIYFLQDNNPFVGYIDVVENIRMAKEQGWNRALEELKKELEEGIINNG